VTLQKSRSPEEYQELLYSIEEECHRLGQLVNQVLELATSDAGVIEQRRVAVRVDEVIRQACEMFLAAAEERGVNLISEIKGQVTILGDPQQLRQLITNLIDNAIKFTPPGGRVTVDLKSTTSGQSVQLVVEDTGIGVAANDLPRIFDRFYRADKSRHRGNGVQGSGLGLAICQAIVHAHHGQILVDSQLGVGTKFTVKLPSYPLAAGSSEAAVPEPVRSLVDREKPLASWAERHSPAT
jgi:signal transduction histidine kinase